MEYTATEKKWMKSRTGSGAILAKTSCEDLVEGLDGWRDSPGEQRDWTLDTLATTFKVLEASGS
jgi:hypothetical protein